MNTTLLRLDGGDKIDKKQRKMADSRLQPFPVSRFIDYENCRCYYAYNNTPAEDFLENVDNTKRQPSVLVLGCGDIRSCFYTLWKNFSVSRGRYDGVRFVLNDNCAAVLARNIIFLYLTVEIEKKEDITVRKKWIAAIWAIYFCHELYPEHERVLKDALSALLAWSESVRSWDESTHNPLRGLVKFATPDTLREVRDTWRMWHNGDVGISSVERMKSMRTTHIQQHMRKMTPDGHGGYLVFATTSVNILVPTLLMKDVPKERVEGMKEDFMDFTKKGSAFAETVFGLPLPTTGKTTLNVTLFDKPDGTYSLHFGSVPYRGFFHTFMLSKKDLKKAKVPGSIVDELLVESEPFEQHPLLANSVQQLSIWLSSAATILNSVRSLRDSKISLTFQCSDAILFCQQLRSFPESVSSEPAFDVIYSSDLIDHLTAPNIVLPALPLLKGDGYLFTSTMLYKVVAPTTKEYLETVFGFSVELLPVICGVRCIGHEGKYADSITLQPVPWGISNVLGSVQQEAKQTAKLLIWKKVNALPLKMPPFDKTSVLAKALCKSVLAPNDMFLINYKDPQATNSICTQTAIHILQAFSAQLEASVDTSDYHFWEDLCILLLSHNDVKHIVVHLQTQALLHGLHLHLTVSPSDCPLCTKKPLSDFVSPFSIEFNSDPPEDLNKRRVTPTYAIYVHKSTDLNVDSLSGPRANVHVVDTMAAQHIGDRLKLDFFFPPSFARDGYNVTVAHYHPFEVIGKKIIFPTKVMTGVLEDFAVAEHRYHFEKVVPFVAFPKVTFGLIIEHGGDGDDFETVVSLSDEVMASLAKHASLVPKQTSSSVLELTCAKRTLNVCYPFPVDYSKTIIKLSRKNQTITLLVSRKAHTFYEEKPMFNVNPDNKFSLPPTHLSSNVSYSYSGMQFTKPERDIMQGCNRRASQMPPIVNLKETVNVLFQCSPETRYYHVSFNEFFIVPDVQGLIMVHNLVFDVQNKTPALDISFCFLKAAFVRRVALHWQRIAGGVARNVMVDKSEYDLVEKVFLHFAARTTFTKSPPILIKHKIDAYFTRALVYPLYSDPDNFIQDMEIGKVLSSRDPREILALLSSGKPLEEAFPGIIGSGPMVLGKTAKQCHQCGVESDDLKMCAGCGRAQYCGKDCQKKHWKEHKRWCSGAMPKVELASSSNTPAVPKIIDSDPPPTKSERKSKRASKRGSSQLPASSKPLSDDLEPPVAAKRVSKAPQTTPKVETPPTPKLENEAQPSPQLDIDPSLTFESDHKSAQNASKAAKAHKVTSYLKRCAGCGLESKVCALKRCPCRTVAYCSSECQKKDWPAHKTICAVHKKKAEEKNGSEATPE